jgi:putative zinc finger/helix-turn-helix YgiT family protein
MSKSVASKPFPWKCGRCRERSVNPAVVSYTTEIEHDGRTYSVTVPDLELPRCSKCGAMVRDDAANRRISNALRQQLGLLTPEQIRENRDALGLTQRELAEMLGIAEATLSRWETGAQIQQRAMDRLLRVTFGFEAVREALTCGSALSDLGTPSKSTTAALPEGEYSAAWAAVADSVRRSLDTLQAQSSPANRLIQAIGKRCWQEKEPEVVNSIVPILWWSLWADRTSLHHWQSVVGQELEPWRHSDPKAFPLNRWLVARLHAEGPDDTDRAGRISRLVEALDALPREKQNALLDEFFRLLELLLDRPVTAKACGLRR